MKLITKLKKELKGAEDLLLDVNQSIDKGWSCYLGEPIYKYRRIIDNEVVRMKVEIKKLEKL